MFAIWLDFIIKTSYLGLNKPLHFIFRKVNFSLVKELSKNSVCLVKCYKLFIKLFQIFFLPFWRNLKFVLNLIFFQFICICIHILIYTIYQFKCFIYGLKCFIISLALLFVNFAHTSHPFLFYLFAVVTLSIDFLEDGLFFLFYLFAFIEDGLFLTLFILTLTHLHQVFLAVYLASTKRSFQWAAFFG